MFDPNRKLIFFTLEFSMEPRLEVLGMSTLLLFAATLLSTMEDTITLPPMKWKWLTWQHCIWCSYSQYLLCYLVYRYSRMKNQSQRYVTLTAAVVNCSQWLNCYWIFYTDRDTLDG